MWGIEREINNNGLTFYVHKKQTISSIGQVGGQNIL